MPPIKAPNKTNETSSKGKTNLLNKISPNNLVDVPSLITTVDSNVCRRIYVNIPKLKVILQQPLIYFDHYLVQRLDLKELL